MHDVISDLIKCRTVQSTTVMYKEFVLRAQEQNPHLPPNLVLKIVPSEKTFQRRRKAFDPRLQHAFANNKEQHNKAFASGNSPENVTYVGELAMVDSTQLNVHIRHKDIEYAVRPYLTVIIDVFSRVITGWHLSISPPTSASVRKALLHACTRKESGLSVIPEKLQSDRGSENNNDDIRDLCNTLGITIQLAAARHSNAQGNVEAWFSTSEKRFVHLLGGTTLGKIGQDRPYPSHKNPVYDLDKLRQRTEEFIEIYNTVTSHRELQMTPGQKFALGTKDLLHTPKVLDKDYATTFDLKLLNRKIMNGRLRAFNLEWRSSALPTLDKKLRAAGRHANLYIDLNDLSRAYAADPRTPDQKIPLEPINRTYMRELSLEMHEQMNELFGEWKLENSDPVAANNRLAQFYRKLREDELEAEDRVSGAKLRKQRRDVTQRISVAAELQRQPEISPPTQETDVGEDDYF